MYTPLDIENKKFAKQMVNGYNVEEVDDFLDELTIDYEKIYKQSGEANLAFYKHLHTHQVHNVTHHTTDP